MFPMFDKDRNEHIDFKELKSVVEATGDSEKDADTLAKSLFETIKKKEDAPISKQEFVAGGEQDPQLIAYFDNLRGLSFQEIKQKEYDEQKEREKNFSCKQKEIGPGRT